MMINRLFVDIYNNVGSNVQDTGSGLVPIIKRYINDTYADFLRRINWRAINYDYSFPTVGGQKDYICPGDFGKELYVYDATNLNDIPFISLQQLENNKPQQLNTQSVAVCYTILDKNVLAQPSSVSTLSILSSSGTDTTQTLTIRGTGSNGIEVYESITLNGSTPVPTVNSYTYIRKINKSGTTTGIITITSNSSAVTNAILGQSDVDYRVKVIRFQDIPGNIVTIQMPYVVNPYPLINDNDTPVVDCADILELGATAKTWRYKRQFSKAADFDVQFEKAIVQKIWNDSNQPNQTHTLNVRTYDRNFL